MAHALIHPLQALTEIREGDMPIVAMLAVKFAIRVTKWAMMRRTRSALRQLEPWQLRDVGLTPEQASEEARRVFWDS